VTVALDQGVLWDAIVEMVTVNGRPISSIHDSGLQMLLGPISSALKEQHPEKWVALNERNVRRAITEEAARIRSFISEEVRGRLISIKLDCATLKGGRSMLGVNIQFVRDGRIILRNLAVKQLFVRHTGENLKREVLSILKRYGVSPRQLYSSTHDNASNMLKFDELVNEEASEGAPVLPPWEAHVEEGHTEDLIFESEEMEDDDSVMEPTAENYEFPEWAQEIRFVESPGTNDAVVSQRCGAHTLQLAIFDALRSTPECSGLLENARKLSAKLRVPSLLATLQNLNKRRPTTDCDPRWNSTYLLIVRLLELEDVMEQLIKANPELQKSNLDRDQWDQLRKMADALEPAKIATIKLQSEQLVIGDFIKIWFRCKNDTGRIDTPLAKAIVEAMESREKVLLASPCIAAAIYLDPRFQVSSLVNLGLLH